MMIVIVAYRHPVIIHQTRLNDRNSFVETLSDIHPVDLFLLASVSK